MTATADPRGLSAERVAQVVRLLELPLPEHRGIDRDEARVIGYTALARHRRRRRLQEHDL